MTLDGDYQKIVDEMAMRYDVERSIRVSDMIFESFVGPRGWKSGMFVENVSHCHGKKRKENELTLDS